MGTELPVYGLGDEWLSVDFVPEFIEQNLGAIGVVDGAAIWVAAFEAH